MFRKLLMIMAVLALAAPGLAFANEGGGSDAPPVADPTKKPVFYLTMKEKTKSFDSFEKAGFLVESTFSIQETAWPEVRRVPVLGDGIVDPGEDPNEEDRLARAIKLSFNDAVFIGGGGGGGGGGGSTDSGSGASPVDDDDMITVLQGDVGRYQWTVDGESLMALNMPFDDSPAATQTDISGNANAGDLDSEGSRAPGAQVGTAMTFDGVNGFAEISAIVAGACGQSGECGAEVAKVCSDSAGCAQTSLQVCAGSPPCTAAVRSTLKDDPGLGGLTRPRTFASTYTDVPDRGTVERVIATWELAPGCVDSAACAGNLVELCSASAGCSQALVAACSADAACAGTQMAACSANSGCIDAVLKAAETSFDVGEIEISPSVLTVSSAHNFHSLVIGTPGVSAGDTISVPTTGTPGSQGLSVVESTTAAGQSETAGAAVQGVTLGGSDIIRIYFDVLAGVGGLTQIQPSETSSGATWDVTTTPITPSGTVAPTIAASGVVTTQQGPGSPDRLIGPSESINPTTLSLKAKITEDQSLTSLTLTPTENQSSPTTTPQIVQPEGTVGAVGTTTLATTEGVSAGGSPETITATLSATPNLRDAETGAVQAVGERAGQAEQAKLDQLQEAQSTERTIRNRLVSLIRSIQDLNELSIELKQQLNRIQAAVALQSGFKETATLLSNLADTLSAPQTTSDSLRGTAAAVALIDQIISSEGVKGSTDRALNDLLSSIKATLKLIETAEQEQAALSTKLESTRQKIDELQSEISG